MNATSTTSSTIEPHEPHWVTKAAFPVVMTIFYLTQIALGFAVYQSFYWLAVPLMLISSHLMHGGLSFSLYRVAHQSHHAHLATERDEELWPFVHPGVSRPARILAAILELGFGMLYPPFLFIRAFVRQGSTIREKNLRRRTWAEFGVALCLWIVISGAVAWFGVWKYFIWIYLAPAWLAANMQSLRKYIEHVGLLGSTVNSSTRSIVARGWLGKLVAFTLLHEPFHGVHHRHSGLPHAKLPQFVALLEPAAPNDQPPFPSYWQAFRDL